MVELYDRCIRCDRYKGENNGMISCDRGDVRLAVIKQPSFQNKGINNGVMIVHCPLKDTRKFNLEGDAWMANLKEVLMKRDEMTPEEADELISEMKERMYEGEDPEELLYEIGLEPDYVFDLLT